MINLHLLHTSYFLFVMTITVLLYAMVRGRPMKLKLTSAMVRLKLFSKFFFRFALDKTSVGHGGAVAGWCLASQNVVGSNPTLAAT